MFSVEKFFFFTVLDIKEELLSEKEEDMKVIDDVDEGRSDGGYSHDSSFSHSFTLSDSFTGSFSPSLSMSSFSGSNISLGMCFQLL